MDIWLRSTVELSFEMCAHLSRLGLASVSAPHPRTEALASGGVETVHRPVAPLGPRAPVADRARASLLLGGRCISRKLTCSLMHKITLIRNTQKTRPISPQADRTGTTRWGGASERTALDGVDQRRLKALCRCTSGGMLCIQASCEPGMSTSTSSTANPPVEDPSPPNER